MRDLLNSNGYLGSGYIFTFSSSKKALQIFTFAFSNDMPFMLFLPFIFTETENFQDFWYALYFIFFFITERQKISLGERGTEVCREWLCWTAFFVATFFRQFFLLLVQSLGCMAIIVLHLPYQIFWLSFSLLSTYFYLDSSENWGVFVGISSFFSRAMRICPYMKWKN